MTITRKSRQNPAIREFILKNVGDNPDKITSLVTKEFGISRAAIAKYLHKLVEEELLIAEGQTKARHYSLNKIVDIKFGIQLFHGLPEDIVWLQQVLPHIKNVKKNVIDICQYGFTEMLNNAADHSVGTEAIVSVEQTYQEIKIVIADNGVGIFKKIQEDFNLPDTRAALLELSKGKLTSFPAKHAGEGIFFTSRMFDQFIINSGDFVYIKRRQNDGWFIEDKEFGFGENGTMITMIVSLDADWTTREIFNHFQGDNLRFRKTHVPIKLAGYPGEQLVSRSQAKRVLARFESFSEVLLDFEGVENIGQAFADEIFRVFNNYHPETKVLAINTNNDIEQMIAYVKNSEPAGPIK